MSNHGNDNQGKRGFVRPQQTVPPVKTTTREWEEAKAAADAAAARDQEPYPEGSNPTNEEQDAIADAIIAAYDRLFGTPAPDGAALAYKLGLLATINPALGFDPRKPDELAQLFQGGDDFDKAFVACYLDALALAGVRASVRPTYADEASCPAAKIAREMEEVCAALAADGADDDAAAFDALEDRRNALEAALVQAKAASLSGAAAQITLARVMTDRARGGTTQALRDAADDAAEALARSALAVVGQPSPALRAYYLGDSDVSETITDPDAIADRWIAARNALQDEGGEQ